jgi:hypothetical protein
MKRFRSSHGISCLLVHNLCYCVVHCFFGSFFLVFTLPYSSSFDFFSTLYLPHLQWIRTYSPIQVKKQQGCLIQEDVTTIGNRGQNYTSATYKCPSMHVRIFLKNCITFPPTLHTIRTTIIGITTKGILLPFTLSIIVVYVICKNILVQPCWQHFGAFAMFIDSSFSITTFLMLACILTEKNILTTNVSLLHFGFPFTTCPS